jgi:hypothetical protein
MSAKEIRENIRISSSRGKNLYMIRIGIVDDRPRRIIDARQHRGVTEVLALSDGKWHPYSQYHNSFYEA